MNPRHQIAGQHQLLRESCRRDAQFFVFHPDAGLITKDEHDTMNPEKVFPDHPYLRSLLDCLLLSGGFLQAHTAKYALTAGHSEAWLLALASSRIFFVEKSRQMMVSWLLCAYILWRAKYHQHQLILVQSKREDDAANLVFVKEAYYARISFMESHLPKALQTLVFPRAGSNLHLYFPNGSHIWGIPEGSDIIRSNTASFVFSDEAAFQPEFGGAYTAALPAIKGGGQFSAVSSAEPSEFQTIVESE